MSKSRKLVEALIQNVVTRAGPGNLPPLGKIGIGVNYPVESAAADELTWLPGEPVLAAQMLGLGVDYEPGPLEDDDGALDAAELLGDAARKQRVDLSTGLRTYRDVQSAFDPHQIAGRMRPAESGVDQLGIIERLKFHQLACERAAVRMQYDGNVDPQAVAAEARGEKDRLDRELATARAAAKAVIDRRVRAIEQDLTRKQREGVSAAKLMADPGLRALHDLYAERDRLDALLATPAAKAELPNTAPTEEHQ